MQVLQVDRAGLPVQWLSLDRAAAHLAKGNVAWTIGDTCAVLRGGINAQSGRQSLLELKPIIAVVGDHDDRTRWLVKEPSLNRRHLFRRDRHTCAYCGQVFRDDDLTMDHVLPQSRKGPSTWMNLVAACRGCNHRKADRTPEEARMPLLYLPYVPSLHEAFILDNRNILADQVEFLRSSVPAHSRILLH